MRKKFLAGLLALVMLLSLVPVTAFAAEGEARTGVTGGTTNSNGMVLTKTAQLQSDGTYTINLEAFATGTTTVVETNEPVPLDIVLVLDQSGSMKTTMGSAVDKNSTAVQSKGKTPGYYTISSDGDYYPVRWNGSNWQYNSSSKMTDTNWRDLSSRTSIYQSRMGALQDAVTSFVNTILADSVENDVNHRIAMAGFAYDVDGDNSTGPISAGSSTSNWINTGLFINGTLKNYQTVTKTTTGAGYTATFNVSQHRTYYIQNGDNYNRVYWCNRSSSHDAGWYTEEHGFGSHNGTRLTPKTSADGEGTQFYTYSSGTTTTNYVDLTAQDYKDGLVSVNSGSDTLNSSISTAIGKIAAHGATYSSYGMLMANEVFKNNPIAKGDNRQRIVVLFTDGRPGTSSSSVNETEANATINAAYTTKNTYDADVYSVGLFGTSDASDEEISAYMHRASSNYLDATTMSNGTATYNAVYKLSTESTRPTYYVKSGNSFVEITLTDGKWYNGSTEITPKTSKDDTDETHTQVYSSFYMIASDAAALNNIFTTIADSSLESLPSVTLTEKAVMRDIMTPGAFKLPAVFNASKQITVKTQAVTTTDDATYKPGAVTPYTSNGNGTFTSGENTITVTANTETDTIDVTGFDYAKNFVSTGHAGNKIIITITGVEATEAAATGETVYTNSDKSGIYDGENMVTPIVTFPSPDTVIDSKSYVLDYAKQFDITDLNFGAISHVDSSMAKIIEPKTELDLTNGYVEKTDNNKLTYTPQTMNWHGYDKFFTFGTGTESLYHWSKVNVIPANNVYYEDDFITAGSTTDTAADDVVGIEYGTGWSIEYASAGTTSGSTDGNTETENGAVQGWEEQLADDTTFSDNAAHVAGAGATATFTFTGTGVDIYSYTDMNSGMVVGMLYKGTNTTETMTKLLMIDNFAQSGAYYQIPTLSFQELDYGTYTVKLVVNKLKVQNADGTIATDEKGETVYRDTYYLDGIRIYNPIKNIESTDETVQNAYTEKDTSGNITSTELNAVFAEVRDLMAENSTEDGDIGTVFIDLDGSGNVGTKTDYDATEYGTYGPKNEIYLAAGQSITFKVDGNSSNFYQVGLKAPEGDGTTAAFSKDAETNSGTTISHSTDLYYKVTPVNGYITIKNTGNGLLSVTKIKMTGTEASGIALLSVTADEASAEITAFSLRSVVAYDAAPEEDVPEVPETSEPPVEPEIPEEPIEPETPEVPDIDIEIENPVSKPEKNPVGPILHHNLKKLVNNLFNRIHGWFGR